MLGFMTTDHLVPSDLRELYHVREWRNATGVLATACPEEWTDLIEVLRAFRLLRSEVLAAGGGLSPISKQVDGAFAKRGWRQKKFATKIVVDATEYSSPTHLVDRFKARRARAGMEQQRPILRSRPQQFPPLIRASRNRCRRDPHSSVRIASRLRRPRQGS